ncbi:MAG: glycosyltransferase family 2 protein [Bdellovibrionales bacterium]|nr:glycosyltransferase family 2 protein [Bdellovibrionales bacterium]
MKPQKVFNLSDATVVIPAYNEEEGIQNTLETLKKAFPEIQVIVVNDGSKDRTFEIASSVPGVQVLNHELNRGYGAALKTGMRRAETPVIAWYDADGQHRTEDLQKILEPILNKQLDVAIGARGKGSAFVAKRVPGKILLRFISQLIARRKIPDLNCGLRAFRRDVIIPYLPLLPNGFSASATTTLLMLKRGYHTRFIPVHADPRVGTSTVKMSDGLRTMMILYRILILFDSFLLFFVVAMLQVLPALAYSIYKAYQDGLGFPVLGATILTSGLITLGLGVLSQQINEIRQERLESSSYEHR